MQVFCISVRAIFNHRRSCTPSSKEASYIKKLATNLFQPIPTSGETLRDAPVFFHYLNFIHEVPEHTLQTDIYLPLT